MPSFLLISSKSRNFFPQFAKWNTQVMYYDSNSELHYHHPPYLVYFKFSLEKFWYTCRFVYPLLLVLMSSHCSVPYWKLISSLTKLHFWSTGTENCIHHPVAAYFWKIKRGTTGPESDESQILKGVFSQNTC